mmetsp:Transcript_15749/g.21087  ORF Transcript_15749/g.21087 Transcript_15749/m.21087 type:complete len:107 (+) Transcript_15749:649-969(+)
MKEKNRNPSLACEHQGVSHAIDSRSGNGDGMTSQDAMAVLTNIANYDSPFPATVLPILSSSSAMRSSSCPSLPMPRMFTLALENLIAGNSTGGKNVRKIESDGTGN